MGIRRMVGGWFAKPDQKGNDPGQDIEAELARTSDRIRRADPETERQWQMLRTRMEALGTAAPRPALRPSGHLFRPVIAIATVGLILLAGDFLLKQDAEPGRYSTGRGERSSILLPDSSEVILNHTSDLSVPQQGKDGSRNVVLAGEAYFHIRKNGSPFIVSTAIGRIEVLGTRFNVRIREDRLEVAVVSGTVQVSAVDTRDLQSRILPGGTIISFRKNEPPPEPEKLLFPEYPGWLHRKLLFQRSPLSSVCAEIEATFDITVRIERASLAGERISGALDSRNANSALTALAQLSNARLRQDANTFVLY